MTHSRWFPWGHLQVLEEREAWQLWTMMGSRWHWEWDFFSAPNASLKLKPPLSGDALRKRTYYRLCNDRCCSQFLNRALLLPSHMPHFLRYASFSISKSRVTIVPTLLELAWGLPDLAYAFDREKTRHKCELLFLSWILGSSFACVVSLMWSNLPCTVFLYILSQISDYEM